MRRDDVDAGYDTVPDRPAVVTVAILAGVVVVSAAIAEAFRRSAIWAIEWYSGASTSPDGVEALGVALTTVLVAAVVLVAAALARRAVRVRPGGSGLEAIAASARGERRRISVVATLHRVGAIWGLAAGLASIGREAAIIEAGGTLGSATGRLTRGKGDAMAVAGIAAAFAAAYHAPLAATVYVEEHLGVRRSRRAARFTVAGALGGHLVAVWLLGGHTVFPGIAGSRWGVLVGGLGVVLPCALVARVFLRLRTIAADGRWATRLSPRVRFGVSVVAAVVAGLAVAVAPAAAGNGMDGLRLVPVAATTTLALSLLVGKLIGTTAALAAGAPGGVISPSMAISGGAALLIALGAERSGMSVDHPWDIVVAALVVGIAVGLRSPIMAPVLVAELLGDYTLLPALALIALVAHLLDRLVDLVAARFGQDVQELGELRDEDA